MQACPNSKCPHTFKIRSNWGLFSKFYLWVFNDAVTGTNYLTSNYRIISLSIFVVCLTHDVISRKGDEMLKKKRCERRNRDPVLCV